MLFTVSSSNYSFNDFMIYDSKPQGGGSPQTWMIEMKPAIEPAGKYYVSMILVKRKPSFFGNFPILMILLLMC